MDTTRGPHESRSHRLRQRRTSAAYGAIAVGVVLMVLGWYGVSGEAELAKQIPYLASGSLPGLALIAGGVAVAVGERTRRSNEQAAAMVSSLYRLLTEPVDAEPSGSAPSGGEGPVPTLAEVTRLVAVPEGSRYHRAECALVGAKPDLATVDAAVVDARGLAPCPICEPPTPVA